MARSKTFRHVSRIEVHLWDQFIGVLARDPRTRLYVFRYTDEFRRGGIEPAPLRMPVGPDTTWAFPDLSERTYHGLPALVNDSLPDAFGNRLIEKVLGDMGVEPTAISPLDRLAYLGDRAMGALRFKPPRSEVGQATAIELKGLVEEARRAIGRETDDQTGSSLRHIIQVGISAGGARPKAVVCWNPSTGQFRSGQFDAPDGFEHWLLKFDGVEDANADGPRNEGRIEYAYHRMAKAAGIEMAECRLHEEGGRAHFMTRRFDRESANTRHHIQTLCAMDHMDLAQAGAYSYAQFFQVARQLGLQDSALDQAFRRMAFNVMARNLDDHTKNHSFRLRQGGAWELSPAYDLTYAHNPNGRWNHQHFLSVHGKHDGISRADLLVEAERFSIARPRQVLDEVRDALERWSEFAAEAGVPGDRIQAITADHLRL
jgi:serine/threonine-protein kinase HipA